MMAFLRCCGSLPSSPDGQPEPVVAVLWSVTHRLEPALGQGRRRVDLLEKVHPARRYRSLDRLGAGQNLHPWPVRVVLWLQGPPRHRLPPCDAHADQAQLDWAIRRRAAEGLLVDPFGPPPV